jgi:hypothetical protein
MGYCAWIQKAEFSILSERIPEAFAAVMASKGCYHSPKNAVKDVKHFEHLPLLLQFTEAVKATYGFVLTPNKSGDIDKISHEWEKVHGDELWEALAPFVKSGSYIQWCGEDGEKWRNVFQGGKTKQVKPVLTWPE